MVQRGVMTEPRPCVRPARHKGGKGGAHSPDLSGLRFGRLRVINQGPKYINPTTSRTKIAWNCIDLKSHCRRAIVAGALLRGRTRGIRAPRGTGHINEDGYHEIMVEGKRILEHRFVISKIIGRPLTKDETVHHGPMGRACNDPENLSIRLVGNHPRGHSEQELAEWLRSLGWVITPPQRIQL